MTLLKLDEPLLSAVDMVATDMMYVGIIDASGHLVNCLTRQRLVAFLANECDVWEHLLERPIRVRVRVTPSKGPSLVGLPVPWVS